MTMIQLVTNDDEHNLALQEIDRLWNATAAGDIATLEALTMLVERYEEKRWPSTLALDPIDVLKHAMSPDIGHSKTDFVEIIGSAAGASQILARKRPLTLDMIRKLSERWGIAIELLTPAYQLDVKAAPAAAGSSKRPRLTAKAGADAKASAKPAPRARRSASLAAAPAKQA